MTIDKQIEEALEEVQLLLEQEKRTGINNPEIAKGRKTMHLIAACLQAVLEHEIVEINGRIQELLTQEDSKDE